MRRVLPVMLIVLASAGVLAADQVWIPLAGEAREEARVEVVTSTTDGVELDLTLSAVGLEAVSAAERSFTQVEIPGLGRIGETGAPELPVLRRFVEIPFGATATVEAQALDTVRVDLGGRGLPSLLYPAQLPLPKCDCEQARSWRFSFKEESYRGVAQPAAASLSGPFTFRDHTMMLLTLAPLRYDATAGRLEVASRMRVQVRFAGGDIEATRALKQRLASRHFDSFLERATVNLDFGGRAAGWHYPTSAPVEFLIIAPNDAAMLTALEPFVAWKTSCGFHVNLVTTAVTGTTTTAIKSYITGLYNGANPPVYILMIGDSPTPLVTFTDGSGGSGGTDLPFVQMDADLYADMIIARWPVDDAAELVAMRDKILFYEQPTAGNSAWLNRALYLGGDDYQGWTTHQDVIAQLMAPAPNSAECAFWDAVADNPTTAELIADLNTGRGWAVYSAHSGPDGWSGRPPFSSSDVPNMNNVDKYPLGFGHSCQSNMWNSYADVFGEVTVTQVNKGFVSYWGGSNSTYWNEDDWLERGFFDSMFDAGITGSTIPLNGQYSQGAACYAGLTNVTLAGGNESYYWPMYNLDGDPSLDPFTKQPIGLTVGADPVVPPTSSDAFTVTASDSLAGPVAGALVGVTQNGTLLGAGYTDVSGTAVFHIDAPVAGSNLLVRVTAHNHLPTDAVVLVAAGSDGVVVLDASRYVCTSTVGISVFDDDLDGMGTINVTLSAAPSGDSATVTLTEQPGTAVQFSGSAVLGVDLTVAHGDTITVSYYDADTGGGVGATKTDTATLDCAGPQIGGLAITDVGGTSAVVSWTTDEPASSVVTYDTVTPPAAFTVSDPTFKTSHVAALTGLTECTDYYLFVSAADADGNGSVDDNGGAYYTFTTLKNTLAAYASTDTPLPINDNATASSVIAVADDKMVVDVDVEVNITHTYDGDIHLTLVAPNGTEVTLSANHGGSGAGYTNTIFDDEASTPIASGTPPYTGSFKPDSPLSVLDGISALGNWTFRVADEAGGDTGTLNSWTLHLTYPNASCGPHGTFGSHVLVADDCGTGGAGDANGVWDAGEAVQFSVALTNDGTVDLTGVTATVVALTPGVLVTPDTATFPAIAIGGSATSNAPHFTAYLPESLACGQVISFEVHIGSDQGNWVGGIFDQVIGTVISGDFTLLSENFESAWGPYGNNPPTGWTIVDAGDESPATWNDNDWHKYSKGGAYSNVARVYYSPLENQDELLTTPTFDIPATATTINLDFDHYFQLYASGESGTVLFDSDQLTTPVVLATYTTSSADMAHVTLSLLPYLGHTNAQVTFRYQGYNGWRWEVDNVVVSGQQPGGCEMDTCVGGIQDADLWVRTMSDACYALPGSAAEYTITVGNAGPGTAFGATVVDTFPAVLQSPTWTCSEAGGGNCPAASGAGNVNAPVDLPVGTYVEFTVDATVATGAVGWVVNTATVTGVGNDPVASNNSSSHVDALEVSLFCDSVETGDTSAWFRTLP